MSWNYRIVKTEKGYGIFEVYYNESGVPNGLTAEPIVNFYCDKPEKLLEELELIKSSLKKNVEVLNVKEIGGSP